MAVALTAAVLLVGTGRPAFAEQSTGRLIAGKLFRGIVNLVTGWMEIPKQVTQEADAGRGFTRGFAKGIGYAIGRTSVGGYEILTFPFPLPEEYRPIVHPEYVLSDQPFLRPERK